MSQLTGFSSISSSSNDPAKVKKVSAAKDSTKSIVTSEMMPDAKMNMQKCLGDLVPGAS